MWGKVAKWGGTALVGGVRTENFRSVEWISLPHHPPTLALFPLVGQSPDFEGIFHGAKDLLKTKKIQNPTKVNLVKAFKGT